MQLGSTPSSGKSLVKVTKDQVVIIPVVGRPHDVPRL